ncbi:DnaD domain-containing protein [Paenibacillus lutrae]|uniref:DnaD domain protein n=1 Tax=Paenibacillus lutrae TaxID=2078573 RepID=A0A7X3JZI4_9BACL|nr:DnaD domain protein [Paenibacillus lutrae]MVO99990.1 DnaD domain protein [Paenibacillus lutrae]
MKPNDTERKQMQRAILAGMTSGTVAVPHLLLKYYHRMKLSEIEGMLLIHLIAFQGNEKKDFPTHDEILARMSAPEDQVIQAIQKLVNDGILGIDEHIDSHTGIQSERYNLGQMFEKIAAFYAEDLILEAAERAELQRLESDKNGEKNVYMIFEAEFARPLTPMELETITSWLDRDEYKEELVLAALKEAVFAGKVHFRYIDRILLEWSRNRIFTVEQAKEFTQKFRGSR